MEEVIIINNNSSKDYAPLKEFIENCKDVNFKYIQSNENLGVSRGRNYAIQQAKAPLLLMLDDDCELAEKNALLTIDNLFKAKPNTGLFDGNGQHTLYNRNRQISQKGTFRGGRLYTGKVFKYNDDGILTNLEMYQSGKYIGEGVIEKNMQ